MEWIKQLKTELRYCNNQLDYSLNQEIHFRKRIKEVNYRINKLNDLGRTESAEALKNDLRLKKHINEGDLSIVYGAYEEIVKETKNQHLRGNITKEKSKELRNEIHKILLEKKEVKS